jgi:predicted nucleic acid-binding protein
MKKNKVVLDTNVLIYGINEDSEFFHKVRNILSSHEYDFYITTKAISEFVSVLSKLERYDIIEKELPVILGDFKIIYPDKKSLKIFWNLLRKYRPTGNRVFDVEIVSLMLAKKIKNLFTINIKDFRHIEEIELPGFFE